MTPEEMMGEIERLRSERVEHIGQIVSLQAKLAVATREYGVAADERDVLKAKLAEAQARLAEMYERIIPEEIAKGCSAAEAEVERLKYDHKLAQDAWRHSAAEVERLRGAVGAAAFKRYSQHDHSCPCPNSPCDCGLVMARAALRGGGE
jgi:hypothetical protein